MSSMPACNNSAKSFCMPISTHSIFNRIGRHTHVGGTNDYMSSFSMRKPGICLSVISFCVRSQFRCNSHRTFCVRIYSGCCCGISFSVRSSSRRCCAISFCMRFCTNSRICFSVQTEGTITNRICFWHIFRQLWNIFSINLFDFCFKSTYFERYFGVASIVHDLQNSHTSNNCKWHTRFCPGSQRTSIADIGKTF